MVDICKGLFVEIPFYLKSDEKRKIHALCRKYPRKSFDLSLKYDDYEDIYTNPLAWTSQFEPKYFDVNYTIWATVWLRINCASSLLEYCGNLKHLKLNQFINAHIDIVRYLDMIEDPRNEFIDFDHLCSLYRSMGKSYYDEDRNLIQTETKTIQQRPYPLKVIRNVYPDKHWTIEEVIPILTIAHIEHIREADYDFSLDHNDNEEVYYACLYIMVQCKDLHVTEQNMDVRDALWFYHAAFFDFCFNFGKVKNLDSLYPHDNRAFTAYDLPDILHIMAIIPLQGEQMSPSFPLGEFIQKSLPFAGARRTLIEKTDKILPANEAFWKIFSSVFYCMLLDMYPESLSKSRERCFDIKKILKIMKLVTSNNLLRESLARTSFKDTAKENDKGCYIVFTAFRLWIALVIKNQPHYKMCIDWDIFEDQAVEIAATIRDTTQYDSKDVFYEPREILSKGNKNPKTKVYRYRTSSVYEVVSEKMIKSLEKDLYKELGSWNFHLSELNESKDEFANEILKAERNIDLININVSLDIKTRILNTVKHIPSLDWLSPTALSILRSDEYGGISRISVGLILKLVDIYYKTAKPKEFEHCISLFTSYDFAVISWYFRCVNLLSKIDVDTLSQSFVDGTDNAMMTSKFVLYPGQELPKSVYNVFFTICCGKIKTLQGKGNHGHDDIAWDIERNVFICAKSQKKNNYDSADDLIFSEFKRQKKQARDQRKEFNCIPCKDNPVLCISLRGYMLIYKKTQKYVHCPKCGSFHRFEWNGHLKDSYSCSECNPKVFHFTCHVCSLPVSGDCIKYTEDPLSPNGSFDIFQKLYFCRKHFKK